MMSDKERLKLIKQREKELIKHNKIMALAVRLALNKRK